MAAHAGHRWHSLPSRFGAGPQQLTGIQGFPSWLPGGVEKGTPVDCHHWYHHVFNNSLFLREPTCYITPQVREYCLRRSHTHTQGLMPPPGPSVSCSGTGLQPSGRCFVSGGLPRCAGSQQGPHECPPLPTVRKESTGTRGRGGSLPRALLALSISAAAA